MRQVTLTGVAVAVTRSPGTTAVFDRGTHIARFTHSHVGRRTSCRSPGAGEDRITGLGSSRSRRAIWPSTPGGGTPGPPPATPANSKTPEA